MDRTAQLDQELKRILPLIEHDYKPERIILFGSLASRKIHEWSDIDLVIIKKTPLRFIDRIGEVLRLTRPHVGFNVVVYTPQEVSQMEESGHYFWKDEILAKGKVLYDRAA